MAERIKFSGDGDFKSPSVSGGASVKIAETEAEPSIWDALGAIAGEAFEIGKGIVTGSIPVIPTPAGPAIGVPAYDPLTDDEIALERARLEAKETQLLRAPKTVQESGMMSGVGAWPLVLIAVIGLFLVFKK